MRAGDAEGANEMSYSMGFLRQFCRIFQDQAGSTRIFFPDDKVKDVTSVAYERPFQSCTVVMHRRILLNQCDNAKPDQYVKAIV